MVDRDEDSVEFREYLGVLRKYWASIVLLTLLGVAAAGVYVYFAPPVYTAQATVYLSVSTGNSPSDYVQGNNYATAQARSFAQIATTTIVLAPVVKDLGLNISPESLASKLSASIPTNTSLIQITCKDGNAANSAELAEKVAESLVKVIEQLTPVSSDSTPVMVGTIVNPAVVPPSPTSPQPLQSGALGLVAGLAVGIGLAVLRKALDVKLHTTKDVTDATNLPVIAAIPKDSSLARDPVVMMSSPTSAMSERFRQLKTNLLFFNIENDKPWNFVVTSSIEGEGKSSAALNIAYALSENGDRVLLIDADLRRPKIASYLQIEGAAGLTTVLLNRASFSDVVQSLGSGCPDVLTSGAIPPNPAELIGSRRMKQLLEQVSRQYQAVVIDSAPLLPVADTLSLLPHVGGVVMVAAAENVTVPELKAALESIEPTRAPVMGVVLNKTRHRGSGSGYYNYNYTYDSKGYGVPKARKRPKRAQS